MTTQSLMSWGKGLEEEDTFCYTTDSQVVGQKPIVERVNFQALPTSPLISNLTS